MVDFSNFDPNMNMEVSAMCPEGNFEFTIESIGNDIKKSVKGNEYFQIQLKRAGYFTVYLNLILGNKPFIVGKLVNFFSSVGQKLEKRVYSSEELLMMAKQSKNKKVEAEIYHEEYSYDGKSGIRAVVRVFKPAREQDANTAAHSKQVTDFIDSF